MCVIGSPSAVVVAAVAMVGTVTAGTVPIPERSRAAGRSARIQVTGEGSVRVRADTMFVHARVRVRTRMRGDRADGPRAVAGAASTRMRRLAAGTGAAVRRIRVVPTVPATGGQPSSGAVAVPVTVEIRPLDRADRLLAAVLAAGPWLSMSGVWFDKSDPSREWRAARGAALRDARGKALRRAAVAGHRLGAPMSVRTEAVDSIPVVMLPRASVAASHGRLRPAEGLLRVTVRVGYAVR